MAGIAATVVLAALAIYIVFQRRLTPVEKERRRRVFVNRGNRTIEGVITEAGEDLIHFQYELRGVMYFASQDVTALRTLLPPHPDRLIGAVSVKYDPRNPANSIVICEDWSGLTVKRESQDAIVE
ncbi:hypothetical protein [uncultured Paludibaculum sp.]|uniref:hypothetical protein n=1 Tax=uncultured Paludibaculum sp. TaxID=1765020 RepID=UPI002AAB1BEA|nr:hypothetical protein [uncultured Paludibaculum sp.]